MKFVQAFFVSAFAVVTHVDGFLPLHHVGKTTLMDRMLTTRLDRHHDVKVVQPINYKIGKTDTESTYSTVLEKEMSVVEETKGVTLSTFLAADGQHQEHSDLTSVFDSIQDACKDIAKLVKRASFEDTNGLHEGGGSINVQGEEQKKLDVLANDVLKLALSRSDVVQTLASEEEEVPISRPRKSLSSEKSYIVAFDPLDGSSNIVSL